MSGLGPWVRLARPFTLLSPAMGIASGSMVALGTLRARPGFEFAPHLPALLGGVGVAVLLNAGSNALNQIYDLEIDRVNKPDRPLPKGEIPIAGAWAFAVAAIAATLAVALLLNRATFHVVLAGMLLVVAYSAPPLRTKRFWWAANPTIALPRGTLVFVAGWTAVDGDERLGSMLLWVLGAMFGLFILGAATTKDYADIPGDRAQGCVTLPIRFGVRRSIWITAPFFVLPWLLLPVGAVAHGEFGFHAGLGIALALWGAYIVRLLLRDPESLTSEKTHPSWQHMYLLLTVAYVGVAAGFWLPR